MQVTVVGIKDFRQNISELTKKAQESNITYLILRRKKPVLEVKPCFNKDISLDYEMQINYYKTLESSLEFWNSSDDDNIFKTKK